jgi:hypothetical protein
VFEIVISSADDPEDGPLAGGDLVECLGTEADHDLAAVALGRDEAGVAEPLDMVRHERLGQSDVLDEVGDGRVAARQTSDDAEPVHVGQRLVEGPDAAQVVRLIDERRDRAADPGGRGRQDRSSADTNVR